VYKLKRITLFRF